MNARNALAAAYQEHGAGLVAGDQNAINALATLAPKEAIAFQGDARDVESHGMSMKLSQERLAQLRAEGRRSAQNHSAKMSEAERAQAAADIARILSTANAARNQGPEAFAGWVQQNAAMIEGGGLDAAKITYETFPGLAASYEGAAEGLSAGFSLGNDLVAGQKLSAPEAEISRLVSIGIDRPTAVKINAGVLALSRDEYGGITVVDKSTGQIVSDVQGQPTLNGTAFAPQAQSVTPPAAQRTAPQTKGSPASFVSAQEHNAQPPALNNAPDAFGIEGTVKGSVNAVSDFMGMGTPFEDVRTTQDYFAVLSENLTNAVAMTYGRQPTGKRMDQIQALTAQAGGRQGAEGAKSKLRALQASFQTDLTTFQNQAKRRMRTADRAKVEEKIIGIQAIIGQLDQALSAFAPAKASTTQSGVKWRIKQ